MATSIELIKCSISRGQDAAARISRFDLVIAENTNFPEILRNIVRPSLTFAKTPVAETAAA